MPSTITLAPSKGLEDPGSYQVSVDGKDWLFQAGRPVDDVPDKVVKALEATGAKFSTGKEKN